MLANAHKQHRHIGRMYKADEGAHHVSDSIAFGDDEAVELPHRPKRRVEIAGLGDRVGANQSLSKNVSKKSYKREKSSHVMNVPRRP